MTFATNKANLKCETDIFEKMTQLMGVVLSTAMFWTFFLMPVPAKASDRSLVQWHTTNVQFLTGKGYKLGESQRDIITLQHANGWTYGDNMFFYDATLSGQDYFEWHPRLSLGKIKGKPVKIGPIKDVLLAGTLEVPQTGSARYLIGAGFDWDVPGFNFVKTNFYLRDNPDLAGTTWGTTFAWKKKFKLGSQPFLSDGFIDMAGSEGPRSGYQLAVPTLLTDIGYHFGKAGTVFLGVEYQYWNNKFGIKGIRESVVQAQLRLILK